MPLEQDPGHRELGGSKVQTGPQPHKERPERAPKIAERVDEQDFLRISGEEVWDQGVLRVVP